MERNNKCIYCNQEGFGMTYDIIDNGYYHEECLVQFVYETEESYHTEELEVTVLWFLANQARKLQEM